MARFLPWLLIALSACGPEAAATVTVSDEPPETAASPSTGELPTATPEPATPWAVRYVLSCTEWASRTLFATDAHVFACDGATYDVSSGRMVVARREMERGIASYGSTSIWQRYNRSGLVVRNASLSDRVVQLDERPDGWAFTPEPMRLMFSNANGVIQLDLDLGRSAAFPNSERCTQSEHLGVGSDGRVRCVHYEDDRRELVTIGQDATVALPSFRHLEFAPDGTGLVYLATADGVVHWLGFDGVERDSRPLGPDGALLSWTDRGLLVSGGGRTELWELSETGITSERVYEEAVQEGVFAGAEIVLSGSSHVVWLHRGPPRRPSEFEAPVEVANFEALRVNADGEWAGGGGTFPRGPNDVAAYFGGLGFLRLSRIDADEFAGYDDDAWARAVMGRYLDEGQDRWAKTWRVGGRRVLRGHSYIGGCERADIDVLVREHADGSLERWTGYGSTGVGDGLIDIPERARSVEDGIESRYTGDPSTGRIE